MLKKDLLRMVVSNLLRMKFRALLTILGVSIGTAAIVVMVSLGVGMQLSAMGTLEGSFGEVTQVQVLPAGQDPFGAVQESGTKRKKEEKLNNRAVAKLKNIKGVVAAMPVIQVNATNVSLNGHSAPPMVFGIDERMIEEFGFRVAEGDDLKKTKQAVVGAKVPELLAQSSQDLRVQSTQRVDVIGKNMILEVSSFDEMQEGPIMMTPSGGAARKYKLNVTGILKEKGFESDMSIFLTLKDAIEMQKQVMNLPERKLQYSKVLLKVESPGEVTEVEKKVKEYGYSVFSLKEMLAGMRTFFLIIQAVLGGIASIALLVASLGIVNTMTMAIYERTKEIGIMKAVGASRRDIMSIFLTESGMIGFLGGIFGAVVGLLGGQVINLAIKYYAMQSTQGSGQVSTDLNLIYTSPLLVLFSILFATVVGLMAGVFPSLRAADMSPLGALRHE